MPLSKCRICGKMKRAKQEITEDEIIKDLLEFDKQPVLNMPPNSSFTIKVKIISIKKASANTS